MISTDNHDMTKQDLYKYLEHHNKCALQVSKQISENALIEIVKDEK
jgi:hypothetical protein